MKREEMMMKGVMVDHDNMSNLTSASAEISASSSIRNESGGTNLYNQYSSASTNQLPPVPPPKRKRNLPGNPDPDAEVIALSPNSLLATNRFICQICNKGFKRDQNLQLHRRGHNLPWKLKQNTNKEVRKKVYVCPESTCVHHDPSRALGDLTGIKKHFCRKHGEKKWKCEKCSKLYAVRSDWKAHSKICGTREYRCDCGTLFSRRDSFITHRAFCDALAQETSGRGITVTPNIINNLLSSQTRLHSHSHSHSHGLQLHSVKREEEVVQHLPWLAPPPPPPPLLFSSSSLEHSFIHHQNPNPSSTRLPVPPTATATASAASPHTSATALLQRATQMGAATISKTSPFLPPHQPHMSQNVEDYGGFGNMMSSLSYEPGFAPASSSYSYADASTTHAHFPPNATTSQTHLHTETGLGFGGNEGLTRDFLGLTPLPHRDFFDMLGLHHINNSSSPYGGDQQNHDNQTQWHGEL